MSYEFLEASLTIDVDFSAIAAGDGLWGMKKGTVVTFDKIHIYFSSYEEDDPGRWYGSAMCHHNMNSFDHGLCYTDNGVRDAVTSYLFAHPIIGQIIKSAGCSEQGRQERYVYDMDVDAVAGVTSDKFEEIGFTLEEFS